MRSATNLPGLDGRPKCFEVICVGEATWKVAGSPAEGPGVRLRSSGGAVTVALGLRRLGFRVGLATVLVDDAVGRSAFEQIAASGVDVSAVRLARARSGLVIVDEGGDLSQLPSDLEQKPAFEIPAGWSSDLLLLSGLSPVLEHTAALCKAARRARREGSLVVLDFNALLRAWAGRDARAIRMVLREVDVARTSFADLAALGLEVDGVRALLPSTATLVVSEPGGRAIARGPFGEVVVAAPRTAPGALPPIGAGAALMVAICGELLRRDEPGESAEAVWHRALVRGNELARRPTP